MLIYGSGGHGSVVYEVAQSLELAVSAFVDDNPQLESYEGVKVVHRLLSDDFEGEGMHIAIGNNKIREKIANTFDREFPILISPSSFVSYSSVIAEGTLVCPKAIIHTKAIIGKHCIINSGAIIEHDCIIGDFTHISTGAIVMGGARIGKGAFIDAGAIIMRHVTIGEGVKVSAGMLVEQDL